MGRGRMKKMNMHKFRLNFEINVMKRIIEQAEKSLKEAESQVNNPKYNQIFVQADMTYHKAYLQGLKVGLEKLEGLK